MDEKKETCIIYNCYSSSLALYLINDCHFPLVGASPNKNQSDRVVFYFWKSNNLLEAVENYETRKKFRQKNINND